MEEHSEIPSGQYHQEKHPHSSDARDFFFRCRIFLVVSATLIAAASAASYFFDLYREDPDQIVLDKIAYQTEQRREALRRIIKEEHARESLEAKRQRERVSSVPPFSLPQIQCYRDYYNRIFCLPSAPRNLKRVPYNALPKPQ